MHHHPTIVVLVLASLLVLGGCSGSGIPGLSRLPSPRDLPFIHKIDIQQGNVITQDMLAQLTPQMDKKKVLFIMGSPIIEDTFNAERWDYIYTFEPGGGDPERRLITLYFKDDKLDRVGGDVTPAEAPLVATLHHDTTVDVPKFKKKSVLTKIKDTLPFVEESKYEIADEEDEQAEDGKLARNDNLPTQAEAKPYSRSPYADLQAAPGEGVVVPPDAPKHGRKRGFFGTLLGSIGLAEETDEIDEESDATPVDPRFRDVRDPIER
ncbi:MAG: outer membrane protein assembly factor BamE [Gammaproteobacteria bacterium]